MPPITVFAPAKLNLHLHIGDKRPDGFHNIESLFLALAWGDTLHVETLFPPLSLEINMNLSLPPEQNIIARAVALFRKRTGYDEGLKITVEKRIPLGGGLGGGSSNAAAALLALNRLFSQKTAAPGLPGGTEPAEMGAALGSDVPFFLANTPAAWVSGRGEKIQPLELPEPVQNLAFVLVNPGFSSDTAEAYKLLDLYRGSGEGYSKYKSASELYPHSSNNDPHSPLPIPYSPQDWPFTNDFLPVFQAESGESSTIGEAGTAYKHIISRLWELGADFAGLSGSGSTCFGVFHDQKMAEAARESLFAHWPLVINTFLLAH